MPKSAERNRKPVLAKETTKECKIPSAGAARKTILIADDEPNVLDLIKLILGDKYNYLEAENGEHALKHLKKCMPDMIVLDVMMPKLNGYELCEMLKKNEKTKGIPVVMVSAKAQEKDIIEGLRLGADYYITKPFDPVKFERQIAQIVSGR
jgi:DNA-binding response OmpR family regulator